MEVPVWKTIGFEKQPTLQEALGFVLNKQTRYGRGVLTQSVVLESEKSRDNKRILEEHLERVKEEQHEKKDEKVRRQQKELETTKIGQRIRQLEHQREILTAMTHFGDRIIDARELAAALAIVHGIHEDDLRQPIYDAYNLSKHGERPHQGAMPVHALHRNMLFLVHRALMRRPPESQNLSGEDVYRTLGAQNDTEKTSIRHALSILDLTGTIQKAPLDSANGSYHWVHRQYAIPEPTWNKPYLVIKDIVKRWITTGAPATKSRYERADRLNIQKEVSEIQVSDADRLFEHLVNAGLIQPHQKRGGFFNYLPTPQAVEWVRLTSQNGILHPEFNIRLLGSKEEKRPVTEMHLQRIIAEVRFRNIFNGTPDEDKSRLIRTLEKAAGIARGTGPQINAGRTSLRGMNAKKIHEIAEYLLRQKDEKGQPKYEAEAEWLRQHANEKQVDEQSSPEIKVKNA